MPITKTTKHYACPDCGELSPNFDHIPEGGSFGAWCCDGCGQGFHGIVRDGEAVLERDKKRLIKTLVLLRQFQPLANGEQLYLVVEGMAFQEEGKPLLIGENDDYFYDEHTCPVNYLRVEAAILDGDADPHGLFQWQETIIRPDNFERVYGIDELRKLFPSLAAGASA